MSFIMMNRVYQVLAMCLQYHIYSIVSRGL